MKIKGSRVGGLLKYTKTTCDSETNTADRPCNCYLIGSNSINMIVVYALIQHGGNELTWIRAYSCT